VAPNLERTTYGLLEAIDAYQKASGEPAPDSWAVAANEACAMLRATRTRPSSQRVCRARGFARMALHAWAVADCAW